LAWGTFSLLEELLLMIVLSFSFREAACFPKESNRFPWEYFVPVGGGYDWRLAERVGMDSKFRDFDLRAGS
jgi:hypothetical protein